MELLTRKGKVQNYERKKKSIFIFFSFKIIDAWIKMAKKHLVPLFLFLSFQQEK